MTPRVVRFKDYDWRVVVDLVLNPDEPETIHRNTGLPHVGGIPAALLRPENLPTAARGSMPITLDPGRPWEWCKECVYNWQTEEYIFEGEDLLTKDYTGITRKRTRGEFEQMALARLEADQQAGRRRKPNAK